MFYFFFSSRRRHTRSKRDWSSDVCSSDLVLGRTDLMADLVRDGHHRPASVGERRAGDENRGQPVRQPPDDFGGGFLARKLTEKLFDVLDFKRALLELVLRNQILHASSALRLLRYSRPGVPQRHDTVEHRRFRTAVGIDAEVSEPLELKPRAGLRGHEKIGRASCRGKGGEQGGGRMIRET